MERSRAPVGIGEEDLASEHVALIQALGATDHASYRGLLDRIADAAKDAGRVTDESVDFVASVVAGLAPPPDEPEAMLAVHMAAIHHATIATERRLDHIETLPQLEVQERAPYTLART